MGLCFGVQICCRGWPVPRLSEALPLFLYSILPCIRKKKVLIKTPAKVKSVDFHPTKPWILGSLESGTVSIWSYGSQTIEKSFKVTDSPVRTAKFIESRSWIVCGSDDKIIRVFDYETSKEVKKFKAHEDFIRCLAVHSTSPLVLSASDDKLIKLWDWEKDWACTRVFEGHSHYVMHTAFSPQDINTFASASMDCFVKIWNIDSSDAKFSWEAHSRGINCVNYFMAGDKLYLISSDDFTAKVWDTETEQCVRTVEHDMQKVPAAIFHPELLVIIRAHPELLVIVTGFEDLTVRILNWDTYADKHCVCTGNYDLGRVWSIAYKKGSNKLNRVAFGCDKGIIIILLKN